MKVPGAATEQAPSALGPALAILASMVSVNAGAAWAKGLFPLVGSEGVTAVRVGLAALLMLAIVRPWRTIPSRRDALNLLAYGLMLGCMNLLIYGAFARIPIGVAVAIEVIGPLTVVVLSSRRARDFAWVLLAAFGLWLLAPFHDGVPPLDPLGVLYALGAAFCWAMYIVFGKRVSNLNGGQAVAWGMLAAALFTVPFGVAHAGAGLLAPAVLIGGLAVAVLSSALPYSLEMAALRRLPQRVFGILVSAGPAFAALAGYVVLGERLTGQQWLAIALVVLACAGAAATAGKRSSTA
ncbi:DMT family transporter [Massilia sp. H6]|uniref:EamA family transporter n=1 Tax=Massilia sp. H6 TaxID=2970464 RepID=UPI00216A85E4|nr:DMT family transporter [Massilia sp. H6]UVW29667.1 DMT family transporter [Massilia sp. H6]